MTADLTSYVVLTLGAGAGDAAERLLERRELLVEDERVERHVPTPAVAMEVAERVLEPRCVEARSRGRAR